MGHILFHYRSRPLEEDDLIFIREIILRHYDKGRSYISRALCETWSWRQPNGKLKEYAARDFLLRLEEQGFISLPPRLRKKNNAFVKTYSQIPLSTVERRLAGGFRASRLPGRDLCGYIPVSGDLLSGSELAIRWSDKRQRKKRQ